MSVALDGLRRRIRELEGRPPAARSTDRCGWPPLDAAGGLPRPGLVAITGPWGAGGTRILLTLAAACTARGERVVWVEPTGDDGWPLHPPTARDWGVALSHLLLVRVSGAQGAWAVEQAAASGACGLVVWSGGITAGVGARLVRAAWRGHGTIVLHSERPVPDVRAEVSMQVQAGRVRLHRRRGGLAQAVGVPAGPEAVSWR